jgi:hypothetical protein
MYKDLIVYLSDFIAALKGQLQDDQKRWGDTWKTRPYEGQTERTIKTFRDYFDQYEHAGVPVNWLKVAGNAFICWVRDVYHDDSER